MGLGVEDRTSGGAPVVNSRATQSCCGTLVPFPCTELQLPLHIRGPGLALLKEGLLVLPGPTTQGPRIPSPAHGEVCPC